MVVTTISPEMLAQTLNEVEIVIVPRSDYEALLKRSRSRAQFTVIMERDEESGDCLLLKPDNAWLIGYTPALVTGVWVGNADSSAMYDKGGGLNTASPIWRDYMIRAHRRLDSPKESFDIPEGIVHPRISLLSGQLPTKCTPIRLRRSDVFLKENPPTKPDPACKQLTIDKVTKLLASESCPADARETGSFLIATSVLPDRWPKWEEGVQEWVTKQMELWYATPDHSGSLLPLPVEVLLLPTPAWPSLRYYPFQNNK